MAKQACQCCQGQKEMVQQQMQLMQACQKLVDLGQLWKTLQIVLVQLLA